MQEREGGSMIKFIELPLWGRSMLLISMFFLLIAQATGIYLIAKGRKQKKKLWILIQTVGTMILLSILAEGNTEQYIKQEMRRSVVYGMKIPVLLISLYEIVLWIYTLKTILIETKIQKSEINKSTIKESADTLPMGLCFARLNGHPYLVNEKMNELSNLLQGRSLQNEMSFWNDLSEGNFLDNIKILSSDQMPSICLDDGTIWVFRQEIIEVQGHQVIQLTATDSTKLYELYEKLQTKNQDLNMINQKLLKYEEHVEELSKAQERLALKVRIHDSIGQNLIATKYFLLQQQDSNAIPQILNKWYQSVAMLRQEIEEEETTDVFQYLMDAAGSAGVKIVLKGKLPQTTKIQEMIVAAGAEALTNAVRHAKADTLWINIRETEYTYVIEFKNEQNQNHQITEGGGLSSLRKRLEHMGGNMEIIADTDFVLKIMLPKMERGK